MKIERDSCILVILLPVLYLPVKYRKDYFLTEIIYLFILFIISLSHSYIFL